MNPNADTKVISRFLTLALVGAIFIACAAVTLQSGGLMFTDPAQ